MPKLDLHCTQRGVIGLRCSPRRFAWPLLAALSTAYAPRLAAQPATPGPARLEVPKGAGQRALVLTIEGDVVRASACDEVAGCDPAKGAALRPPESARKGLASASMRALEMPGGKRIAIVETKPQGGKSYAIVLASVDAKADAPSVLFSGFVGRAKGASTELEVRADAGKKASVKITERASFCGTDVVTSVRTLDKSKLSFKEEGAPDPVGAARANAVEVAVTTGKAQEKSLPILGVRGWSSGDASAIADGDPKTSWVEEETAPAARPFVSLSAPSDVAITGFDIALTPPSGVASPATPKKLLFATDAGLFAVSVPADAVDKGATTLSMTLPKPIRTKCVAVVIDEAHKKGKPKDGDFDAFVSEVTARTAFEGKSLEDLARGLGGAQDAASEKVLAAAGTAGVAAIASVYPKLDGPAKDRARRIVDAKDCDDKMLLYIPLLTASDREESDRARDRIRRCGKEAGPALVAAFDASKVDDVRGLYAEEAALVAPDLVTKKLVDHLGAAKSLEERRSLRKALTKGALRAAGVRAIDTVMADPSFTALGTTAKIDVLRALGPNIKDAKNASAVFAALSSAATEFRDQYVLLGPASELARSGDGGALSFMEATLSKSADHRLRARAATLASGIDKLRPLLIGAIDDEKVRVREAALVSLTTGGAQVDLGVGKKLAERVEKDPWTFVRLAAASALAGAPKDAGLDERIAKAVDLEEQPSVRAEMVRTLGSRSAGTQVATIHDRAFDSKEALTVRLRAIDALGAVCARGSTDGLVELALKGRTPLFGGIL